MLCGDLLRFLANYLSDRTKFNIIMICKIIRNCCMKKYVQIDYVDQCSFVIMPQGLKKYVFKLKNVTKIIELPSHVTHLKFSNDFNEETNYSSLKKIKFLAYPLFNTLFNQSINHLPNNLIYLSINGCFNQPINCLPSTLRYLIIKGNFNQPIDDLPRDLTHLCLEEDFNKSIDKLPSTLMYLKLGRAFNKSIKILPSSLKYFSFYVGSKISIKHTSKIYFIIICNSYNSCHSGDRIYDYQYNYQKKLI